MKALVRTLLCLYALWRMMPVDGEFQFVKLDGSQAKAACFEALKTRGVTYPKKHGAMIWYAPDPRSSGRIGCWPDDFDPRDK